MARAGRISVPPLLDAVRHSDADGVLLSLACSTYALDQPNFFEYDFLPTLFGLGGVRDRGYTAPLSLERKLREISAAFLICDAHALVDGGRPSLHIDILPVSHKTNHAKVVIIHRKRLIRLVISSANLTHNGYRRDREAAVVLDFKPERGLPVAILRNAVREWLEVLGDVAIEGLREALQAAIAKAEEWEANAEPLNDRNVVVVFGGGPTPLWQRLADAWPVEEPLLEWIICSPFWPDPSEGLTPFEVLAHRLNERGANCAETHLTVLACADSPGGRALPKFPFALIERLRTKGFPIRHGAIIPVRLATLPEEIADGEPETQRPLHAKWVLLRGPDTAVVLLGSANFTRMGLGVMNRPENANIEAAVLITSPASLVNPEVWMPPVEGGIVDWATCGSQDVTDPEEGDPAPHWPVFLARVELDLTWGEGPDPFGNLLLVLRPPPRPAFTVRPATAYGMETSAAILWSAPQVDAGPADAETQASVSLDADVVRTILVQRSVLVVWDTPPTTVKFPVNINATSKAGLPSVLGVRPDEQQLLAYFHGRIDEEGLIEILLRKAESENGGDKGLSLADNARLKQLQNYLVREFVESLFGMANILRDALRSPCAFQQALLGEFSPIRLAQEVLEAFRSGRRSPTAAAFQLVELLGVIVRLDLEDGKPQADERKELEKVRERGVQQLLETTAKAAARMEFRTAVTQQPFSAFIRASLPSALARRWFDMMGQANGPAVEALATQPGEDHLS
jgi:hypothetical protein